MAFAKLWNAFFGKRSSLPQETAAAPHAGQGQQVPGSKVPASVGTTLGVNPPTATIKLSRRKTKSQIAKPVPPVAPPAPEEPAPVLRMFRRKSNGWTKLIGNRTVRSILDIHAGDGSRAVEILESLVDSEGVSPNYIAIGLFEQADEPLTVRQFHQKVRSAGGNAVVIPMSLAAGLRRLSQTIGTVDLLIIDGHEAQLQDAETVRWLRRVTSPDSLVLRRDTAGRWQPAAALSRKAA
ncbi:MAG: hypothetical protein ACO1RT_20520 [Planctomycetaceae bacterium]